jgi:predicted metal-dependent peptidase
MATSSSSPSLIKRLEKLRVQLLFDHPFLSVLALSLPTHYRANNREAFETDGGAIYIDPSRCATYDQARLTYTYAHTLLHILLKHPFRRGERDPGTWNRSCDIVINLLMEDFERIGKRPDDEPLLQKFKDKSVEEVYHVLYDQKEAPEGATEPEDSQADKRDILDEPGTQQVAVEQIDALIVQAIGAAKKAGNAPASLLELFDEVIGPKIDIETLLHSYLTESFFDKLSDFRRPNRRFIHRGLYLPGYRQAESRLDLVVALDRSMSITPETFARFLGILDGVLRISADFTVTVVPFDETVDTESVVTYDAMACRPKIAFSKGNGGTDIGPLLDYLDKLSHLPQVLLILSDGFFRIETPPPFQTLFILSKQANVARLKRYGDVAYFDA